MKGDSNDMVSEQGASPTGSSIEVEVFDYLDYYGISKGKEHISGEDET
jgi:hypothetical protein